MVTNKTKKDYVITDITIYLKESKMKERTTIIKPILLLLHQTVALYIIFDLLSTNHQLSETEVDYLTISLAYIMITSLFVFRMLGKLRTDLAHQTGKVT
jgi:hypothetical protein